jgi:outer membrane protein assembly factor BamB
MPRIHRLRLSATILCLWGAAAAASAAGDASLGPGPGPGPPPGKEDWSQWGGSPQRNSVSAARGLPVQWQVGQLDRKTGRWLNQGSKNIRWAARLGSECYAPAVVAGSRIFCTTNNDAGYLAKYPERVDLGCLICFDLQDGGFLWQHSVEKLKAGQSVDWPKQGICGSPLVEGELVWIVTNRGEVACLAARGAGGSGESRVVWSFDMMRELGCVQRYMASCSVTSAGDLLLVCTSNGRDTKDKLPAPESPSFIALHKRTGKLVWADNSPGDNILDGQWSSPAFGVFEGVPQAVFAGGDGWLYSFQATPATDEAAAPGNAPAKASRPKLLWKFDCNPKESRWQTGGTGTRNSIVATPVIYDGRVYIVTGQDPEAGEGPADLWCIDPTKRGDVSAELAVDRDGKTLPARRIQAVDRTAGERAVANPSSAALWRYRGKEGGKEGADFKNVLHRSLAMPAIKDDILVLGDLAGLVHCLDAKTGKVHWTQDMLSGIWAAPLIADGKVYLGTQDGDVVVVEFSKQYKELAKNNMGASVHASPVAVGDTLYVCTSGNVFAIALPKPQ